MARPRTLPPGIRPRGKSFVYDWRDATGKTFRRKAGDTIDEAIAYKAKIDAELNSRHVRRGQQDAASSGNPGGSAT